MSTDVSFVQRVSPELRRDATRVITRLYLPGQEITDNEISRADSVIERFMSMTDEEVSTTLAETFGRYSERHCDIRDTWLDHFAHVAHRLPKAVDISVERRELLGSYFTKEYAIEGAAFFNPSMCAHPDQTGLNPGELRFIMSARAVGEGHISSLEFRTGIVTSTEIIVDPPGKDLLTGTSLHKTMTKEYLEASLLELMDITHAAEVLNLLPEVFDAEILENVLATVERDELTHADGREVIKDIRWVFACNYRVDFPNDRPISERILYPVAADESHGIEDARFTLFVDDEGRKTYYGTYTAYDGLRVKPHLITTPDFRTFDITRLIGQAARNKGMAIFPKKIDGKYFALSRWDRENISVATSEDAKSWGEAAQIRIPEQPWEFIQLGNCGPPIETPEGWIVFTHGVGPMREYRIGAMLLDLNDPSQVICAPSQALITPDESERDGYTPNVVYSCGGVLHDNDIILPYGYSDEAINFARINVPQLMEWFRTCL